YVRGPIEIDRRGDPGGSRSEGAVPPASRHGAPEGTAEPTAVLRVQRSQADAKAERWELLLSLGGTRIVARSITLRATESRFDLAEAVAIGLPDMLARLSEVRHGGAAVRAPSSAPNLASPELRLQAASPGPAPPRTPATGHAGSVEPFGERGAIAAGAQCAIAGRCTDRVCPATGGGTACTPRRVGGARVGVAESSPRSAQPGPRCGPGCRCQRIRRHGAEEGV
ncbi:hypothetical protein BVG81_009255, partial [Haliangium sp. UPWRP_2]